MLSCEDFISDLVDASMTTDNDALRPLFSAHLASCAPCRAELAATRDTVELLVRTRDEPDPLLLSGFARRTALAAESKRPFHLRTLRARVGAFIQGALLVAGGALAVALALRVAPAPELPRPEVAFHIDEIATAEELTFWNAFAMTDGGVGTETTVSVGAFTLDDGLAELDDSELADLLRLLQENT